MQNFVVIGSVCLKLERFKFWSNFKIDRNILSASGARIPFQYKDGLVQERCNSSALPMELSLSCTNPFIWIKSPDYIYRIWQKKYLTKKRKIKLAKPGSCIQTFFSNMGNSIKNMIFLRPPYLYIGNPWTGKMTCFFSKGSFVILPQCRIIMVDIPRNETFVSLIIENQHKVFNHILFRKNKNTVIGR